tara:strand:+ start:115456 stop:115800 length:345 start_codon:yes stop_codon:yes gene_type:complete
MNEFWIYLNVLLPFLVMISLWSLFGMGRSKICPNCNTPFPQFQSPFTKTKRQWMVGGYRCLNCGCETDLAGKKVHSSVIPQQQSVVTGLGLLALILVAILALSFLPLLMMVNRL